MTTTTDLLAGSTEPTRTAFGYLRVSGDAQLKGDGFRRQREAITCWAAAHGVTIIGWFEERGVSGKTDLENRPALFQLIKALDDAPGTIVLIEKMDRLARDIVVQENIVRDLIKRGSEIVSTCEPDMGSNDPSRALIRQIFGVIAEYDRRMLVLKMKVAKDFIASKTGRRPEGQKAYGCYPSEASTLAHIQSLRQQGLNYEAIARTLNADGLLTRSGGKWLSTTIRKIFLSQTFRQNRQNRQNHAEAA